MSTSHRAFPVAGLMYLAAACNGDPMSIESRHVCERWEDEVTLHNLPEPAFVWSAGDLAALAGTGRIDGSIVICGTGGRETLELPGVSEITGVLLLTDYEGHPVTLSAPDLIAAGKVVSRGQAHPSTLLVPLLEAADGLRTSGNGWVDAPLLERSYSHDDSVLIFIEGPGGPMGEVAFPRLFVAFLYLGGTTNTSALLLPRLATAENFEVRGTTGLVSIVLPQIAGFRHHGLELVGNADLAIVDVPGTAVFEGLSILDNPALPTCRALELVDQAYVPIDPAEVETHVHGNLDTGPCE